MGVGVRSRLFALATVVALVVPAAAAAQDKQPRDLKPPRTETSPHWPPMQPYLAVGEDNACGDGCSEWIAAEGAFDHGSAQRLRAFVKRLGRKLPIFFHSIGGIQTEALSVGRFMRERQMTAGVARTIPQKCLPPLDNDAACRALKRSGQRLNAEFRTVDAGCYSACVYALIGATARNVPPGARLGVHSSKFIRIFPDGHVNAPPPAKLTVEEKAHLMEANAEVRRYIREMGIDAGLYDAAMKVAPDQVHYLSRNEIAGFGIDTRSFEESHWSVVNGANHSISVFKLIAQAKGTTGKEFRSSAIELGCGSANRIRLGYFRGLGTDEAGLSRSIAVSAAGQRLAFPSTGRTVKIDAIDSGAKFEVRAVDASMGFFDAAVTGGGLEITELDPAGTDVLKLSVTGLPGAIGALQQSCSRTS